MSRLEDALARIEAQLRNMVEGSSARLFSDGWRDSDKCALAAMLLQALHDHAETGNDGAALAPNQFTLHLPPLTAPLAQADLEGMDDLAAYVHQCGNETGFTFTTYPTITIVPNPALARGQMRLDAQIFPRHASGTTDILIHPDLLGSAGSEEAFLIVSGQWTFPLSKAVTNIGRRSDNDLTINDPRVSRTHAQLRLTRGRYTLFDLGSTGGTYVNGQRVTHSAMLLPGDVISLAGVTLIFGHDTPPHITDTSEILLP